ncbi:MAG: hypothetical protein U1E13_05460 [Methylophilaceae bacterium]|nr:hypothetical protein [Methylophilaceae bacterium]
MARDKTAKFVELANKRVNKALKDIQLIGNLSNRQNYDFSDDQAKQIIKVLQQEVDILKLCFQSTGIVNRKEFVLENKR